ncbi:MAG: EAL domain-containing protein, partial [Candidatus Izemoplasmatales bacterium]|nr:EAL domain-containing protein [Candidatus Izemoplasmatales bacterium]
DLYPKGYIAALLPNQSPFQKCRRIMIAAATLVTQKMSAFKLVDQTRSDLGTLKWAAGSYQFGVFEIENGKIWFKNEIAKDLFGFKEDVTTFESLQKRIKSDPKLYLDDFFRKPSLTFSYEYENSQFRDYHVKLEAVGLKVRGIIEDHTKTDHLKISQDSLINKTDIYGNKLFVLFEKEYLSIQTNHSYLLMTFKMATEPFVSCSLTQFQTFGKELIQDAKTSAKGYLFAIYSLSPNVFVIVLKTTDKRIIDRISNDLHKAAISSKALAYPPALRFASLSPLKKMLFSSIMEALTQLANYDYLPIEGVYYSRNEQLRESELQHSAGVALRRVLQDKAVVIEYHPLVDWQSGLAHMYEVKFSLSQTFASHKILFQAAQKANLIRELHQETIKSLGRDLKKMAIKASADIVYLYRLSRNDLSDMAICSIINSELKRQRISGKKICLLLEYDEANPKVTISRANYFHSEGFGVALSHFVTKIRISDFEDLRQFCLGYVTKREIEMVPGFWLDLVNGYFQEGFVYHHESDTIRKSELESAKCKYVVGRAYPAYQAIDDLIAKIQGKQ